MAPTTEIASWWRLARSPTRSDTPSRAMMKTASRSSVAVSFGKRRLNVITPSDALRAPATIASPSTNSAFASSEPTIDVLATTTSPAERANRTTNSSGRFPSVDWRTPVAAGPKRLPTVSVATAITQASPPSAAPATTKIATGSESLKWRTPVTTVSASTPTRRAVVLRRNEPHALVHEPERRRRGLPGLLGADREQPGQLRLVGADLLVAALDRLEQLHDRLGDLGLERPVALAVETGLDFRDRLPRRHGRDLDQVGDAGLVRAVLDLAPGVGHRRLELGADDVGRVEHQHRAKLGAAGLAH